MLGYKKGPNGQPEIDLKEAEHIRLIFQLFLLGRSLRQIKEALERRNILTPKGNREWSLTTLENILRNEKYMGDVLLQKTYTVDFLTKKKKKNTGELTQYYVTDNHPAIINREVFLQVQAELARRAGKKKASKKRSKSALGKYCSKYSLSERLVCGECGSMYRRVIWTRKDGKKPMWRCINRLEFGTQYCKHSPSLPEGPLHQAILTCIQKVAGKREDILQNLRDVRDNLLAFPDTPANSVSLQQQIDQLQQEMAALVKIMAQGGDSQFYTVKLRQLSEEKVTLAKQLQEQCSNQTADKIRAYQEQQALVTLSSEESLDLTEFHEDFIRRVIEQVTVLSKDRILVRFVGGFEVEGKIIYNE